MEGYEEKWKNMKEELATYGTDIPELIQSLLEMLDNDYRKIEEAFAICKIQYGKHIESRKTSISDQTSTDKNNGV
jgi:hypothetical protein